MCIYDLSDLIITREDEPVEYLVGTLTETSLQRKPTWFWGEGEVFLFLCLHIPSVQVTLSITFRKMTFSYIGDRLICHQLSLLLYTVLGLFLRTIMLQSLEL